MGVCTLGAAVYLPEPEVGVTGDLMIRQVACPPDIPALQAVRGIKESPTPELVRPREFADLTLPLGPALLVHEFFRQPGPELGAAIVESVTHYVRVEVAPVVVELTAQWTALALGEELAAQIAALASTLEFVP